MAGVNALKEGIEGWVPFSSGDDAASYTLKIVIGNLKVSLEDEFDL